MKLASSIYLITVMVFAFMCRAATYLGPVYDLSRYTIDGGGYELTGGVLEFEAEPLLGGNFELTGIVRPAAAWTTPAESSGGFELALVPVPDSQIGPGDGVPTRADPLPDADLDHPLVGDLDVDRVIDMFDLMMLLDAWGPCGDCKDCPTDLDGDCTVGAGDLLILLANWG